MAFHNSKLKTMKPYELTYIISSGITSEDADNLKKDVESFVQSKGGVVLKSERTVPQILSYPIKRNSSGYFVTLEFQTEENTIKEIKEKLEKDEKILRHFLIIKKPIKQMKERRTRKAPAIPGFEAKDTIVDKEKKKEPKVELEDIEKKLDEILSE